MNGVKSRVNRIVKKVNARLGRGARCPVCGSRLRYRYFNGTRTIDCLDARYIVREHVYICTNKVCIYHKGLICTVKNRLPRLKYGLDVLVEVIYRAIEFGLNPERVCKYMREEYGLSVSCGTVNRYIKLFRACAEEYIKESIKSKISKKGYIGVSIDGARPEKGEPELWAVLEVEEGLPLMVKVLSVASSSKIRELLESIEREYKVAVSYVSSDLQRSIEQGVSGMKSKPEHVLCVYHFLKQLADPVKNRSLNLGKKLRSEIGQFWLVRKYKELMPEYLTREPQTPLQLLVSYTKVITDAIKVRADEVTSFKGIEIYKRLKSASRLLERAMKRATDPTAKNHLFILLNHIKRTLAKYMPAYKELLILDRSLRSIRSALNHSHYKSRTVKRRLRRIIRNLTKRLNYRNVNPNPGKIPARRVPAKAPITDIWLQWLRLLHKYADKIADTYPRTRRPLTNNIIEILYNVIKARLRRRLSKKNIAKFLLRNYSDIYIIALRPLSRDTVRDVLGIFIERRVPLKNFIKTDTPQIYFHNVFSKRYRKKVFNELLKASANI